MALWLLSMTLAPRRETGNVELHLLLFSDKLPAVACLLANCPDALLARRSLFIDLLGNIVVFVPLGAALAAATWPERGLRWTRWWLRAGLMGGALSLAIELAQLAIPGRVTDVDDLVFNTLGALVGAGVVILIRGVIHD